MIIKLHEALIEWLKSTNTGDIHTHTTDFSACAKNVSMRDLARASKNSQMPIAVTDHSSHIISGLKKALFMSKENHNALLKSFWKSGIKRYKKYIDYFKKNSSPLMRLGIELDITDDRLLVFPCGFINNIDLFIGHVSYLRAIINKQSNKDIITEWKIKTKAQISSGIDILAHPFRVLVKNDISFSVKKTCEWLVDIAALYNASLEINSHIKCPDVDEVMIRAAISNGVKLAIGTDSHSKKELLNFEYHANIIKKTGVSINRFDDVLYKYNGPKGLHSSSCWDYEYEKRR